MSLSSPLHGRAGTFPLPQRQVVAHADLVAVAQHRSTGEREHQRVCETDAPLVTIHHWREPAADATVVELHPLVGPERSEHLLPLCLREATEIQLVVIAQEDAPLTG